MILVRCPHCKKYKTFSDYYKDKDSKNGYRPRCKLCANIHRNKIKSNQYAMLYRNSKYGKLKIEEYREKHRNKARKYGEQWRQTEKGKISANKREAKRRNNLGWFKIFENPFDKSEEIEWHHINNNDVVAIPKDLHRLYNGYIYHKEMCINIVKQIYKEGDLNFESR